MKKKARLRFAIVTPFFMQGVFPDVHAAGKTDFILFSVCGQKTLRGLRTCCKIENVVTMTKTIAFGRRGSVRGDHQGPPFTFNHPPAGDKLPKAISGLGQFARRCCKMQHLLFQRLEIQKTVIPFKAPLCYNDTI